MYLICIVKYFLGNTSNINGHLKNKHKNALLSNKDKPKSPEASTSKILDIPSINE